MGKSSDPLAPPLLAAFEAIAQHGSITAAARSLRMSQPALTETVHRLERALATTLLVRNARGVTPTATGEVLLRQARLATRALEDARAEIAGLESDPRGRFTIGCHESLGTYFLPGFMSRFLTRHPGVELALWNGNSRDVERAVIDRVVDVGIVVNASAHGDCVVTPLFADRVEVLVASSLRRGHVKNPLALLATHPVFLVPALRQSQFLLASLAQSGQAVRQVNCSSMELVKSLVLDGAGAGVLPWRVATHGIVRGRLVPLAAQLPRYDDAISLVRRYDMHVTRAARLLLDALRDHGKAIE